MMRERVQWGFEELGKITNQLILVAWVLTGESKSNVKTDLTRQSKNLSTT